MTFERFDFDRLIETVADLGFLEMANALDNACARAEESMRGRGGPRARADGAGEYAARIKRVLFWFHHGALADGGAEIRTCHRLAQALVTKGHFKLEALKIFEGSTK